MYVYCIYICIVAGDTIIREEKVMTPMTWLTPPHFWLLSSQDMDFHKNTTIYSIGNPCPDITQAQKCGWISQLMGSQISRSDNWISNDNIDIYKYMLLTVATI